MDRRKFLRGVAGGLFAAPLIGRAQPSAIPVVGFLNSRAADDDPQILAAFRRGLKENGFIEGENVRIEYRFAENRDDRLPALAADLVRRHVAVIAANGLAAQTARLATGTIPIVFSAGFDPVEVGLVASMSRPGANITGVSVQDVELGPKRLELLHAMVPTASVVALLVNPADHARAASIAKNIQSAANNLKLHLQVLHASADGDFAIVRGGRGPRQLRHRPDRFVPCGRHIHRPDSSWRAAR